jgi:hypothetical protein
MHFLFDTCLPWEESRFTMLFTFNFLVWTCFVNQEPPLKCCMFCFGYYQWFFFALQPRWTTACIFYLYNHIICLNIPLIVATIFREMKKYDCAIVKVVFCYFHFADQEVLGCKILILAICYTLSFLISANNQACLIDWSPCWWLLKIFKNRKGNEQMLWWCLFLFLFFILYSDLCLLQLRWLTNL